MAHFATVIAGEVSKVHVVNNAVILDRDGVEQEQLGIEFLADLHGYEPETIVQCSYNGNFRGRYPSKGFTWDPELELFVQPKPYESWVFSAVTGDWEAPKAKPNDEPQWVWDEETLNWIESYE